MEAATQQNLNWPLARTLPKLMAERDIRFRALSKRTKEADPTDKGLTHSYLAGIARGDEFPSIEALELIARALEVTPESFAEVRLARARRLLDEREVGLDEALQNLARVESVLLSRGEGDETPSPTLRGKGGRYAPAEHPRAGKERPCA